MMSNTRAAVAGFLAGAVFLLSGCAKSYIAEVRNDSGRVVRTGLFISGTTNSGQVLESARLGPGEKATLGRILDPGQSSMYVEADALNQSGVQPRYILTPGRTILVVKSEGPNFDAPLRFEVLSTPEDAAADAQTKQ